LGLTKLDMIESDDGTTFGIGDYNEAKSFK